MRKKIIELKEFIRRGESESEYKPNITKEGKDAIFLKLHKLVKNKVLSTSPSDEALTLPKISVSQQIDTIVDALNSKSVLGKILYTESKDDPFEQSEKRLLRIVNLIENEVVTQIIELADAERLYNKLQAIEGFDFNNVIKKLKSKIVNILTEIVESHEIPLLEKIRLCCDAINPKGTMGRILFHQRFFSKNSFLTNLFQTKPCLSASNLNKVLNLIEYRLMLQVSYADEKNELYNELYKKVTEIREMEEIGHNDKDLLYYFLERIKEVKEDITITLDQGEIVIISHAELLTNFGSLQNQKNSFDAPALQKIVINKEISIPEKIEACHQALAAISSNLIISNLIQVFSIINIGLIPQLNHYKDISNLFNIIKNIHSKFIEKNNTQCSQQFSTLLKSLEIRYKVLLPLKNIVNPYDENDSKVLNAAWQGSIICWNHFYENLNEKFSLFYLETQNQVSRMNYIKKLFSLLNNVFNGPIPRPLTEPNVVESFNRIINSAKDIIDYITENDKDCDMPFISKETKEIKIIQDLIDSASIFDIRDLLYKVVVGIEVAKIQLCENIITLNF